MCFNISLGPGTVSISRCFKALCRETGIPREATKELPETKVVTSQNTPKTMSKEEDPTEKSKHPSNLQGGAPRGLKEHQGYIEHFENSYNEEVYGSDTVASQRLA